MTVVDMVDILTLTYVFAEYAQLTEEHMLFCIIYNGGLAVVFKPRLITPDRTYGDAVGSIFKAEDTAQTKCRREQIGSDVQVEVNCVHSHL